MSYWHRIAGGESEVCGDVSGDGVVTARCAHNPAGGGGTDRDMLTWAAAAATMVVLAVRLCAAGLLFCDISLYPEFVAVFGRYRIDMMF